MSQYPTLVTESKTTRQRLTLERQVLGLLDKNSKSAISKCPHWTITSTWEQDFRKSPWRNRKPPPRTRRYERCTNEPLKRQIYNKAPRTEATAKLRGTYREGWDRTRETIRCEEQTEERMKTKKKRGLRCLWDLTKSLSWEYQERRGWGEECSEKWCLAVSSWFMKLLTMCCFPPPPWYQPLLRSRVVWCWSIRV